MILSPFDYLKHFLGGKTWDSGLANAKFITSSLSVSKRRTVSSAVWLLRTWVLESVLHSCVSESAQMYIQGPDAKLLPHPLACGHNIAVVIIVFSPHNSAD